MTQSEFKLAARRHQINFKISDPEINVPADSFYVCKLNRDIQ